MAGESGYQTGIIREQGGARLRVTSTGYLILSTSATWHIAGTAVTPSAAELNILDGATLTVAELNILDGVTATSKELDLLDGAVANVYNQSMTTADNGVISYQLQVVDAAGAVFTTKARLEIYISSDAAGQLNLTTNMNSVACGSDGLILQYGAVGSSAGVFSCVCETDGDVDLHLRGVAADRGGDRWSGYVTVTLPNGLTRTLTTQALYVVAS